MSMKFWQQMRYFNINNKRRAKKKYSLWMKIIKYLNEPKTVQQIAQCVLFKEKIFKKTVIFNGKNAVGEKNE